MKISVIITVLNEENTIELLLSALDKQTYLPSEIIIVDGGSIDNTVEKIKNFLFNSNNIDLRLYIKKGNRSVGRNHAIFHAKNNWIAITDAGCIPKQNWLKELVAVQKETKAQVIAGYYSGISSTAFQKAVIPYVLVMPDQVDEKSFLPATRSMLISKEVWEEVGGFYEKLSDNEDYHFAKQIVKKKYKISFAKNAVVQWMPPSNFLTFLKMIYRFARGDFYSGIIRLKVLLIFLRYLLLFLLFLFLKRNLIVFSVVFFLLLIFYSFWSIQKNYKYVKGDDNAWLWLPILQISSDLAVMLGSSSGLLNRYF